MSDANTSELTVLCNNNNTLACAPYGAEVVDEFDAVCDADGIDYSALELSDLLQDLQPPDRTQIGGGTRQEPTPERTTPTRLRTTINASLRGQDNIIVSNARIRCAQMSMADSIQGAPLSSNATRNTVPQHTPTTLYPPSQSENQVIPSRDDDVSLRPAGRMAGDTERRVSPQIRDGSRRYLSPPTGH
jgi:hypothetical protein